jgi:hypothetical protein
MSVKTLRFVLPLAIFLALVFFLLRGLSLNPRAVPSPLIGKPVPAFTSGIDGFQWLNRAGREGD